MITDNMNTSTILRDTRKLAKLTQQQLSDKYQIPYRTLQGWEQGKRIPPVYVVNMLLRCLEADFGVRLEIPTSTDATYTLTYTNGTPLNLADEMYVLKEKEAKRVELIKVDSEQERTYKCENGFIFKATRN